MKKKHIVRSLWLKLLAQGCLGSNPRGQVVVGAAGHHALVVF